MVWRNFSTVGAIVFQNLFHQCPFYLWEPGPLCMNCDWWILANFKILTNSIFIAFPGPALAFFTSEETVTLEARVLKGPRVYTVHSRTWWIQQKRQDSPSSPTALSFQTLKGLSTRTNIDILIMTSLYICSLGSGYVLPTSCMLLGPLHILHALWKLSE